MVHAQGNAGNARQERDVVIEQKEFGTIDEAEAWAYSREASLTQKGIDVKSALAFSQLTDTGDIVFIGEVIATE